jgi:hypothetical protein
MPTFPLGVVLAAPWLVRAAYGRRRASAADPATSAEAATRAVAARRRRARMAQRVVVGGVVALVVGALLASADAAFAHVIDVVIPDLSLDVDLGTVPARGITFLMLAGIVVGGAYGVLSRVTWVSVPAARPSPDSHAAAWLTPVVLVGAVIGLFLALQATMLFGGADVVLPRHRDQPRRARPAGLRPALPRHADRAGPCSPGPAGRPGATTRRGIGACSPSPAACSPR